MAENGKNWRKGKKEGFSAYNILFSSGRRKECILQYMRKECILQFMRKECTPVYEKGVYTPVYEKGVYTPV